MYAEKLNIQIVLNVVYQILVHLYVLYTCTQSTTILCYHTPCFVWPQTDFKISDLSSVSEMQN